MTNTLHNSDNARSCFFLTLNTIDCVDVFIRPVYKQVVVHTLNHFIEQDKLNVYAWCLMSNHLRLLVQIDNEDELTRFQQEFKTFTTEKILEAIDAEPEVRRSWMLWHFKNLNERSINHSLRIWQTNNVWNKVDQCNHDLLQDHFEHIHQEPVRDRIVDSPIEYKYSSARDYMGMKGLVNISKLPYIAKRLAVSENINGGFLVKYVRG